MADTYTPNLNLTKPEVGASRDTWGGKTNGDWDIVDAIFAAAGSGTSVGLNVGSGKTLTVAGTQNVTGTFKTDTVSEYTSAAGVTVDGVLLKDSGAVLGAGAVGTPSITTTGDTNTGLYFPAADTLAATTGGTERLRIDSSGNVGIGTSSPGNKLDIVSAGTSQIRVKDGVTATAYYDFGRDGTDGFFGFSGAQTTYSGYKWSINAGSEVMRITNGGNVGIGTSSPSEKLSVHSAVGIRGSDFSSLSYFGSTVNTTGVYTGLDSGGGYVINVRDAGYQAFSTSNTERLRINSSGNVGIGTSSPTARLQAYGTSGTAQARLGTANGYVEVTAFDASPVYCVVNGASHTAGVFGTQSNTPTIFFTNNTERARIDTSGNVGIGTSSPDYLLTLQTADAAISLKDSGGTTRAYIGIAGILGSAPTGALRIRSDQGGLVYGYAGTEQFRIDTSGNFLVGTASVGSNVSGVEIRPTVGGNAHPRIELNKTFSGTATLVSFQHNKGEIGRITCDNSSTAYVTSSDYRLKENVVPLTAAAARVRALKPSRFNFIADPSRTVDGFIAHEAAEVVPEAVSGEKDAVNEDGSIKPQGIDHSKLVPLLTAALQEALTKIATLEARLTALEAK